MFGATKSCASETGNRAVLYRSHVCPERLQASILMSRFNPRPVGCALVRVSHYQTSYPIDYLAPRTPFIYTLFPRACADAQRRSCCRHGVLLTSAIILEAAPSEIYEAHTFTLILKYRLWQKPSKEVSFTFPKIGLILQLNSRTSHQRHFHNEYRNQ